MATKVDFVFDLDQKVIVTATGESGVITNLNLDDGGKKYYVQGSGDGKWWAERFLVAFSD